MAEFLPDSTLPRIAMVSRILPCSSVISMLSGLTGSEGGFHDWNYLLDTTGMLGHTKQVAGLIRFAGTAMIVLAIVGTIYFSSQNERMFDDDE